MIDTDTDIRSLSLTDDSFDESASSQAGFRRLAQFLAVERQQNPPEWERPGEQVAFIFRTLGWYAKGEMVPAPGDHGERTIYCPYAVTKDNKINLNSKLGAVLKSFRNVFGEISIAAIEGKVCWLEDTVLKFGTIETKPTPIPIGVPTPEEVAVVRHLIGLGRDTSRDTVTPAAPPEGVELTPEETEQLLLIFDGKSNQQLQLAVLQADCPLTPRLKQAVLRDQVREPLMETGRLDYVGGVYRALPF